MFLFNSLSNFIIYSTTHFISSHTLFHIYDNHSFKLRSIVTIVATMERFANLTQSPQNYNWGHVNHIFLQFLTISIIATKQHPWLQVQLQFKTLVIIIIIIIFVKENCHYRLQIPNPPHNHRSPLPKAIFWWWYFFPFVCHNNNQRWKYNNITIWTLFLQSNKKTIPRRQRNFNIQVVNITYSPITPPVKSNSMFLTK